MNVVMKTYRFAWILAVGTLLGGSGAAAVDSAGQSGLTAIDPKAEAATKTPKRSLHQGMTADEVIAIVGKPDKVAPMKTPDGKAEIWTYRRQVGTTTMQVPSHELNAGYHDRPSAATDSQPLGFVNRPSMAYALETTTTYQVTSLLMYEDKLVVAKQWTEQEKSLNE